MRRRFGSITERNALDHVNTPGLTWHSVRRDAGLMAFVPPGPEERLHAIGSLAHLPARLQRAFSPGDDFEPVPLPARRDWLNVSREPGQSFERFTRTASRHRSDGVRRILLQPLGSFPTEQSELLLALRRFATAFFGLDVQLLPPLCIDGIITTRRNRFTGVLQLKTRDILPLLASHAPPDGCVLAVTAHDLYAHDTWRFVFGEAIVDERVGVIGLARYDPRFYDKPSDPVLLLCRSCKVLAHEVGHMLGMLHCVFFSCLMNGSNSLAESDGRPLHLCPVDLRKLQWLLGFDIVERYRHLLAFWRDVGVTAEVHWIERRLEIIEGQDH
ncbi:MAG: archaemetzincin [Vicinamibacteraceae bacterium]